MPEDRSAAQPRYVQLDPSLTDDDLLALGVKRDQLPVYHRMQKHGAWVVDPSDCSAAQTCGLWGCGKTGTTPITVEHPEWGTRKVILVCDYHSTMVRDAR